MEAKYILSHEDFSIGDLVDLHELAEIFEKFTRVTGFTVGFLDHPGLNVLIATGWKDLCTRFHRVCPSSMEICRQSNSRLLNGLEEPGQIVVEPCAHGLVDCATPIIIGGRHVASLATGQFLLEKPDREWFRARAREFGFDEDAYLKALDEVPVVDAEKVKTATAFLGSLASFIAQKGLATLQLAERTEQLTRELQHVQVAEDALKTSEARFRSFIEQAPVAIGVFELSGTGLYANQAFLKTLGLTNLEAMVGRPAFEYFTPQYREDSKERIRRRMQGLPVPTEYEAVALRANGEEFPVQLAVAPIQLSDKTVSIAFLSDISERKLSEDELHRYRHHLEEVIEERTRDLETTRAALADSISRYNNLVDNSRSIILEWDNGGNILFLNRFGLEFFGFSAQELVGRNVVGTIVEPVDQSGYDLAAKLKRVLSAPDEYYSSENENIRKNGQRVWVSWTNIGIRDPEGRIYKTLSVGLDRTLPRQAEIELAEYRHRLEEMVTARTGEIEYKNRELGKVHERLALATHAAKIGVWDWDVSRNELVWDDSMYDLYGLRREDFAGAYEAWSSHLHPENKARVEAEIQEALRGEHEYAPEFRVIQPDGTLRHLKAESLTIRAPDGTPLRMVGTNIDITERRTHGTRQALYLSVLKRLGDGDASDAVVEDILEFVARALDIEAAGIRLERNGDFPFLATLGYTPDFVEKERTLCRRIPAGEPLPDTAGRLSLDCICGAVVSGLLDTSLPFVTSGGSLWVNSTSSLTSKQTNELLRHLVSFRGRCVDAGFESLALIPLRSKDRIIGLLHLADHRKNRLSLDLVEYLEGLGSSIAIVIGRREAEAAQDRLEEQIRQSQKMESVGRLAGGVAHDFNNLLTAISGYGEMLLKSMEVNDPRRADLLEMLGATERGSQLTHQLLAFSRKQVFMPDVLDLNASVESTLKMLKRMIGEDIVVKTDLEPAPCRILSDVGQIGQVIMNLAVNARDAMPDGGILRISTRNTTLPELFFHDHPELTPGPLVELRVADTGCGMPPEVMEHVFEPFFTTKEKGKGTGLGLPTVYGIVRQSGGCVLLESVPGQGTTFTLYFPHCTASPPEGEVKPQYTPEKAESSACNERILLVEDEDTLRRLCARVLKGAGYAVTTAASAEEALSILEKMDGRMDLVISDMVMPGMNGKELAREVFSRDFCHHVLFVSGYTDDMVIGREELESGFELLQKPFSPQKLLGKVRDVLNK